MSYQLPNGAWVSASGGFGQGAGGAWGGNSGGGGNGGIFGGGYKPSSAYGGSGYSNFGAGAGRLSNGRLYEPPPYQGPSTPFIPRVQRPNFGGGNYGY